MFGRPGSGPPTPLSPRKKVTVPSEYQDTVPGDFEEKIKQPKSMSQGSAPDSRPQTPVSEHSRKEISSRPSPKLTRASSKLFERVRVFEERRKSIDNPEGSISGRSWAGFHRASSIDSDDGGSRLGISRESSKEDLHEALRADGEQRRSSFRQRASSLDERPRYSQKVQDIESKFTEELQRIKKLVGKPHLKKSFSTEQLSSHRGRSPMRKLEPIPPQVLQKLQDRERAQQEKEKKEEQQARTLPKQKSPPKPSRVFQKEPLPHDRSPNLIRKVNTIFGEASPPQGTSQSDLPGQRSPRLLSGPGSASESQRSPTVEVRSLAEERPRSPRRPVRAESPSRSILDTPLRKLEPRPASPLVKRVSGVEDVSETHTESESAHRSSPVEITLRRLDRRPESPLVKDPSVQSSPKPPRIPLTSSCQVGNMSMDVTPLAPAVQLTIPQIVVEDEPTDTKSSPHTPTKEEQVQKPRGRGRRQRPMSPELGQ